MDLPYGEYIGTLVAAFAGAWFAFLFEGRRRRNNEVQEQVRQGNVALYTLYEFWNALKQYHDEVVQPFKDRPDAWMNMSVTTDRFSAVPSLHNADISFVLGTPHTNVYAEVFLQEHRFNSNRSSIRTREEIILNHVRPVLRELGVTHGSAVDASAVIDAIGDDVYHMLSDLTSAICSNTEQNLESFRTAYTDLRGALQTLLPGEKIIAVQFDNESDSDA